ncbi:hypothetical protein AHF37_07781, partial [Paragonimus kellicotti]
KAYYVLDEFLLGGEVQETGKDSALNDIDMQDLLQEVCELDIIFHFEKAYYVLDEFLLGGEVQETGKDSALNDIDMQDLLQEEECKTREEQADISVIDVSEF